MLKSIKNKMLKSKNKKIEKSSNQNNISKNVEVKSFKKNSLKSSNKCKTIRKVWVATADMGYGHQRAAFPLKDIAYKKIYSANSDKILTKDEEISWKKIQNFYEFVSRCSSSKNVSFGKILFKFYDKFQSIKSLYPFRDLSKVSFGVTYFEHLIMKKKLGKSIVSYMQEEKIPFLTTFHITALAAEQQGLNPVYCVVTDTDINRVWVPRIPEKSNIIYLAPCKRAMMRLKEYGIRDKNIIYTGFPLPKENIGKNKEILNKNLARRLSILDPRRTFYNKYKESINSRLKIKKLPEVKKPLVLSFFIGGAGAQKDLALSLLKEVQTFILSGKIILNLVVGMHPDLEEMFKFEISKLGMNVVFGEGINIYSSISKKEYFEKCSEVLNETDILWTKPSEMSFYAGLGIPLILSNPIGAHEHYNKRWVLENGAGMEQQRIEHFAYWFFEKLRHGRFAEMSWNGFMNCPTMGTYNIEKIVLNKFDYDDIKFKNDFLDLS